MGQSLWNRSVTTDLHVDWCRLTNDNWGIMWVKQNVILYNEKEDSSCSAAGAFVIIRHRNSLTPFCNWLLSDIIIYEVKTCRKHENLQTLNKVLIKTDTWHREYTLPKRFREILILCAPVWGAGGQHLLCECAGETVAHLHHYTSLLLSHFSSWDSHTVLWSHSLKIKPFINMYPLQSAASKAGCQYARCTSGVCLTVWVKFTPVRKIIDNYSTTGHVWGRYVHSAYKWGKYCTKALVFLADLKYVIEAPPATDSIQVTI